MYKWKDTCTNSFTMHVINKNYKVSIQEFRNK